MDCSDVIVSGLGGPVYRGWKWWEVGSYSFLLLLGAAVESSLLADGDICSRFAVDICMGLGLCNGETTMLFGKVVTGHTVNN